MIHDIFRFSFPCVEGLICRVDFARADAWCARSLLALPEAEQRRSARLAPEARERHLAAWGLLLGELGRRLSIDPTTLRFDRTREGKPLLISPHAACHFNLAHSAAHVAIALSSVAPVGIDVDELRSCRPSVLERFHPAERSLVDQQGRGRDLAFTRLWVAKEACVKCRGRGGVSSVEAGVGVSGRWRDVDWRRVEPWPDAVAAVAVQGG